jgi:hypothetical protein
MRRRSSVSPVSADELEVLAEAIGSGVARDEEGNITGIEGFVEALEKQPGRLAVNPAYAQDEALLKRIDRALGGVKGIPEDFIVQELPVTKMVVAETAPDAVFRLEPEIASQVFPLIANVSISAAHADVTQAWELVKPMLLPDAPALPMRTASLKRA